MPPDRIDPPLPLLIELLPVAVPDVLLPDFDGPLLSPAGPAAVDVPLPVAAPSAAKTVEPQTIKDAESAATEIMCLFTSSSSSFILWTEAQLAHAIMVANGSATPLGY